MLQEESERSQDTGDKGDIEIGKIMITLEQIIKFRSICYDTANSGKHGEYSFDIEEFDKEVEAGFSDNGEEWTAKDGHVLKIMDIII